ncbi:MAG: PIN domain-containing protein [Synergistaceae bacterium]|nr:PIN domain-containing protein [Synergistaceae bacterium]
MIWRTRKDKIYLDTSVMSHLFHEDVPGKMGDTLSFWEDVEAGMYDVVISEATLAELEDCREPKRSALIDAVKAIGHTFLPRSEEAEALADAYVREGVLTSRHRDDLMHIALAVVSGCDIIVSWNFKHMVHVRTIQSVRAVNAQEGWFKSIDIVSPTMMLKGGEGHEGTDRQP